MKLTQKRIIRAWLTAALALCLTVTSAIAAQVHLTGSTNWALGSLLVSGSAVGLQSSGIKSGYIRFVGYGYCFTGDGDYWTPTDPNQMDDDAIEIDDYPETQLPFSNPPNKLDFSLTLVNPPGASQPDAPCAPGTWVWKGATLQVWQNFGAPPGKLLAQKNYACFDKKNGDFECR